MCVISMIPNTYSMSSDLAWPLLQIEFGDKRIVAFNRAEVHENPGQKDKEFKRFHLKESDVSKYMFGAAGYIDWVINFIG